MKHRLDYRSITFKTWLYFILFTTFLMIILWFLQVLFLNNFYEVMKKEQTDAVVKNIKKPTKSKTANDFSTISKKSPTPMTFISTLPRSTGVLCISNHPATIPVPVITPIRSQRSMKSFWNLRRIRFPSPSRARMTPNGSWLMAMC